MNIKFFEEEPEECGCDEEKRVRKVIKDDESTEEHILESK